LLDSLLQEIAKSASDKNKSKKMTGVTKQPAVSFWKESYKTKATDMLMGESRVMFRWRSSLWKLIWKELLVYTITFLLISMIYRLALSDMHRENVDLVILWFREKSSGLPLTFLLGFYVSLVVRRWWEQYCKLPWPDNIAIYLRGLVTGGQGDQARIVRRTVVRYCLLSYILCIRRLSVRLRKRFPTMHELVRTGILRSDEALRIGEEDSDAMYESNWWMPLKWAAEIMAKAQKEDLIKSAPGYAGIMGMLSNFRSSLGDVATYGHIPVPLVYTQVVTLAVYVYFAVSLIGEQWTMSEKVDLYYPIFMTVKFLFFFGWLRVAETLYNPFGEDDDDFELNELLNRHFKVAMNIVDQNEEPPELQRDIFWGKSDPELTDQPSWGEMNFIVQTEDIDIKENLSNTERRDPMM